MATVVEIEELSYDSNKAQVPARLYRPASPTGAAIVLLPGRTREIDLLDFIAAALAQRGTTVLASRYRGMELRYDNADASAALDTLAELELDGDRMAVVGHSRGGICALRIAASDDRVKTAVSLQPPVDLDRIVRATEFLSKTRYRTLVDQIGGTPDEVPERYRAASALPLASQIKPPCLLVSGIIDLYAPAEHIEEMYDALQAAGNTRSEYVVLECGHFFETTDYRRLNDQVVAVVCDWLGRHL
jgi:dipeptidyl aminopeptidase/acylaminoacyl peptidase